MNDERMMNEWWMNDERMMNEWWTNDERKSFFTGSVWKAFFTGSVWKSNTLWSLIIRSSFAHHSLMMIIRSSFVHRSLIIPSSFKMMIDNDRRLFINSSEIQFKNAKNAFLKCKIHLFHWKMPFFDRQCSHFSIAVRSWSGTLPAFWGLRSRQKVMAGGSRRPLACSGS